MKYKVNFQLDFKRNETQGKYIVFEGIDGSGKTTQVEKLAEYFRNQGKEVILTREPRKDEGVIGKLIAEILKGNAAVPSTALQYLFTADRVMHYEEIILPSLELGKIVISDRCFWSAIPYGILDRMQNGEQDAYNFSDGKIILVAQSILSLYHQFLVPDATFYLDVPVEICLRRLRSKEATKEIYETREKLDKIKQGYEWLLKEFPKEIKRIDGRGSQEEISRAIVQNLELRIQN